MMTREAWIGVMAAALGVDAAACHKSVPPGSEVSSREVVSLAPSNIDSPASASPMSDASTPLAEIDASIGGLGTLGTGHGGIIVGSNPQISGTCGATPSYRDDPVAPRVNALVSVVTGAQNNDERVVAGMRAGFRACANKALMNDPALKDGKLTLELSIAPTGDVSSATVASTTLSTELSDCIVNRSKHTSFDPNAAHTLTFRVDIKKQP